MKGYKTKYISLVAFLDSLIHMRYLFQLVKSLFIVLEVQIKCVDANNVMVVSTASHSIHLGTLSPTTPALNTKQIYLFSCITYKGIKHIDSHHTVFNLYMYICIDIYYVCYKLIM